MWSRRFLFHFFGGCAANDAFLWITLVFTLIAVGLQLTGDEGSVLTSAVMTTYSIYLCYSAVSNNPDSSCNPTIGQDSVLSVILGIGCIIASMVWTTYSYANSPQVINDCSWMLCSKTSLLTSLSIRDTHKLSSIEDTHKLTIFLAWLYPCLT